MIKSVFTAHLSEQDKKDLTLLINDRSFGSLAPENKSSFVLTSSRDIHMVSGFSNQSTYYDPRFNRDRIYLWNQAFKEMQAHGLKAFPNFIYDHHIYAEYLYIFSADIFIGWQDRNNGLYLLRNRKLYRLQPTILPPNVFDDEWMRHTDFYSFAPKTDDLVFSISYKVFEQIDPSKAERIFQDNVQLSNSMSEMIGLLRTYEQKLDLSWLGFEIERVEKNVFARDNEGDLSYVEGQARLSKSKRDFTRLINSSRVSRVIDGQRLIPAPKPQSKQRASSSEPTVNSEVQSRNNINQRAARARTDFNRKNDRIENARIERERNIRRLEDQRPHSDIFWEDIRSFSFEPIINNFKAAVKNFFSLVPQKPILSKILATTIIFLAVLLFVLIGRTIGSKTTTKELIQTTETTILVTRKISVDEEVVAPDSALLEIDITVKANNLQIRQEPRTDAPIVATVQRGAKLTQLSEPINNWVFVRLADGETVGYAYADSILDQE